MPPPDSAFALVFLAGLLGGFGHCAGMCGPLAAGLALRSRRREEAIGAGLLYHLGRVTTYALLGGATAVAGSLLSVTARIVFLQKAAGVAGGLFLMLLGADMAGYLPRRAGPGGGFGTGPLLARLAAPVLGSGRTGDCYPAGLLLGLLPCGLVYTALLAAAQAGMEAKGAPAAFVRGFLLLAAFGAGTVPALLLVGTVAGILSGRARRGAAKASALLAVLLGLLFVARTLRS